MKARTALPYVNAYKDRTGKMRYYLRRPGCRMVALPGLPGSREFLQAYAGATPKPKIAKRVSKKPGQIYFLSDGDHVKIGFTRDWEVRKKKYETHSAKPPTLLAIRPGTPSEDLELRRRFKPYRLRGDWFHPAPELLAVIKETIGELNAA